MQRLKLARSRRGRVTSDRIAHKLVRSRRVTRDGRLR
jgi:hypothetical protein